MCSFSDELEELNACRCQATLPGELYAFLKGWLRWGSEPSPDYDHEVRSRVRAGISIAHRFSRVGAAGSCLPWERAPSVVAALQEELGLGDEAILSHVVECPFILSLSWELHMAPSLVLLQTWVPECNDDAATTRAWVCSRGFSLTDSSSVEEIPRRLSTRLLALAVVSSAGVAPSAEEISRLIDEFGVTEPDPMIAAYWRLSEEEKALQRHLRLNFDQMMVMRRLSSPTGLAHYFTPSMERATIASLEALRSDLELGTAEFSFFVVRMPALVEAHLERDERSWLFHRVQRLGFTYVVGRGGQVYYEYFGNHAQLGKLVVAVADVLARGVGIWSDILYREDHFLPRYSRFNERQDSCLDAGDGHLNPTEADLARYTTTMGQMISVSSGDKLVPHLDDLFDDALSRYDHGMLVPHASGYRPIFDGSLSPFEAAYFATSDLAQSVFTAHRRRKAGEVRPLVMIDLENVGNAVQLLPQLHAMDGIEVRAYVADTHPLRAKATHRVPVGLSKRSKKLFDAVDIRMVFDAGQYANMNPDAKTNILVVSKDNFANTTAVVVNPADATVHATDLIRKLPRFWAQQLGVHKLIDLQ